MAATVYLSESNGAVEAVTDNITNINLGGRDIPNLSANQYPIIIGGRTYAKWLRVKLSALGGSNQIANLKIYKSAGAYQGGGAEVIGTNVATAANSRINTYAFANVGHGEVAVTVPYNGDGSDILGVVWASAAFPTALPASENIFIGNAGGAALTIAGTYSKYFVMALATTNAVTAGALTQKTFLLTFDET